MRAKYVGGEAAIMEVGDDDGERGSRCVRCGAEGSSGAACMCPGPWIERFWPVARGPENIMYRTPTDRARAWWRRVTRTMIGGSEMPLPGSTCVVLKGSERRDLGRMGVVLATTERRVQVGYRDSRTGMQRQRAKHPSSLIFLEDGLELRNADDGSLWVVRQQNHHEDEPSESADSHL